MRIMFKLLFPMEKNGARQQSCSTLFQAKDDQHHGSYGDYEDWVRWSTLPQATYLVFTNFEEYRWRARGDSNPGPTALLAQGIGGSAWYWAAALSRLSYGPKTA